MRSFILALVAISQISLLVYGQDNVCIVCGEGKEVTKPDQFFSFPGQPTIVCGVLETAGMDGLLPIATCPFLPHLILEDCGCAPKGTPAPTPTRGLNDAPTEHKTPFPTPSTFITGDDVPTFAPNSSNFGFAQEKKESGPIALVIIGVILLIGCLLVVFVLYRKGKANTSRPKTVDESGIPAAAAPTEGTATGNEIL